MSDADEKRVGKPWPMPQQSQTNEPFWAAAKDQRLLLQYQRETSHWQFWPRPNSVLTGKPDLEWRESGGRGFVYSYTISAIPAPGFEHRVPYAVGLIELDEGVRMIAKLLADPAEITIGMRVRVVWEALGAGVTFPAFLPDI